MVLNAFQQWLLLALALFGILVLFDSVALASLPRVVIMRDLFIGALGSILFTAMWNWLHMRKTKTRP